jgi:hypothetical protein
LYLIQFRVEGAPNVGDRDVGDDGDNSNDHGYDDDAGVDAIDHEDDIAGDKLSGGKSNASGWSGGQGPRSFSGQPVGKKGLLMM